MHTFNKDAANLRWCILVYSIICLASVGAAYRLASHILLLWFNPSAGFSQFLVVLDADTQWLQRLRSLKG